MSLGPETFKESWESGKSHIHSRNFEKTMVWVKYIFTSTGLLVISFFVIELVSTKIKWKAKIVFLFSLLFTYTGMLYVADSFFDRYHIPMISIFLILLAYPAGMYSFHRSYYVIPLLFFMYVAVLGTKDYFTMSRTIWEAYNYLRQNNIPRALINGGFEINLWCDGEPVWWIDFSSLDNFNYLIQYNNEEKFKLMRNYPIQRYFPFKKDTIRIFKRSEPVDWSSHVKE